MAEEEKPQKNVVKLSKTGKGVAVLVDGKLYFTSKKSMQKVLNGAMPYSVLRKADKQPQKT